MSEIPASESIRRSLREVLNAPTSASTPEVIAELEAMIEELEVSKDRTTVYRLYDKNDVFLYVGITNRNTRRLVEHSGDKEWWPQVDVAMFEHYETRVEAIAREAELIPKAKHNIAGKPKPKRSKPRMTAERKLAEMLAEEAREKDRRDPHFVRVWIK